MKTATSNVLAQVHSHAFPQKGSWPPSWHGGQSLLRVNSLEYARTWAFKGCPSSPLTLQVPVLPTQLKPSGRHKEEAYSEPPTPGSALLRKGYEESQAATATAKRGTTCSWRSKEVCGGGGGGLGQASLGELENAL